MSQRGHSKKKVRVGQSGHPVQQAAGVESGKELYVDSALNIKANIKQANAKHKR
jgi:hypothetical protein